MDLEENLNSLLQSELTAKGGRRKFTFVAEFSLDKNELKKENEGNTPCVSVMDEKMSKVGLRENYLKELERDGQRPLCG